jgi:hypothetical protein
MLRLLSSITATTGLGYLSILNTGFNSSNEIASALMSTGKYKGTFAVLCPPSNSCVSVYSGDIFRRDLSTWINPKYISYFHNKSNIRIGLVSDKNIDTEQYNDIHDYIATVKINNHDTLKKDIEHMFQTVNVDVICVTYTNTDTSYIGEKNRYISRINGNETLHIFISQDDNVDTKV